MANLSVNPANGYGIPMPLLMMNAQAVKIEEAGNTEPVFYDPVLQIVYGMRTVGTKSLKTSVTQKKTGYTQDKKNEIDDSKYV